MKSLFINAKVWLRRNNFAEAIGFDSQTGKIIFTGGNDRANAERSEYDKVTDLHGKLVLPAFTEGHCHFIEGSYYNSRINLREAKTRNDFIKGIREYKKENSDGWIDGGFYAEANFTEKFKLDKNFLDEILSDIPVIISRFDSHGAVANSKALELSGLLNSLDNFTPEEIIKDKDGNLTGELKERARDFVLDEIPPASISERTNAALKQMMKFHSYGITSISDITLVDDLEIYKELISKNKLLLNVDARLPFSEFYNISKYQNEFSEISERIKFHSLKAFYDGSLSSKTSYMHSNFMGENHNGIKTEFVNSGEFKKLAFEIDDAGLQMSVHAIGDKAVTELLALNEQLNKRSGMKDRRFRIEHAQHIKESDFDRFKKLNVIASVQPSHLFSDAKTASEILTNPEIEHNYKKLFDIGARVCFGTDFPIVGANPFETIYFAMTRKAQGFENGFVPENNIPLIECLEAYTINNAYATYEENKRGSLEVGKEADIIVLENNLFEMTGEEILNAGVDETYIAGKKIFGTAGDTEI